MQERIGLIQRGNYQCKEVMWNYLSVNPDRPKRERVRERSQEEERYQEASRQAEKAENVSPG